MKTKTKNETVTKSDIKMLSQKIDKNQKALDQIEIVSQKLDRNQKALDQIEDVARILRDNEQNLKDLGNLKSRLDLLDKIYVKIDKIAGDVSTYREQQELNSAKLTKHDERIEAVEKHLHLPMTS